MEVGDVGDVNSSATANLWIMTNYLIVVKNLSASFCFSYSTIFDTHLDVCLPPEFC